MEAISLLDRTAVPASANLWQRRPSLRKGNMATYPCSLLRARDDFAPALPFPFC